MPRLRLDLAYDGNAYHGWAAQPGLPTVEGALREALATVVRRPVPVTVAGRTDAGVHARGQVVHLDLSEEEFEALGRGRDISPVDAMHRRLSGVLGREDGALVLHAVREAPADFDARFSALSRTYSYRMADQQIRWDPLSRRSTAWVRSALDETLMDLEAMSVLGLHNFGSFCKPRDRSTTVRELQEFRIRRGEDGVLSLRITADAFCHHMVRALVGACIEVGEGRREPGWLTARLGRASWDQDVRLAPPHGLVLDSVQYPQDAHLRARARQTRALREAS
ncbi:tRNA pseudouridine(38-40) synthase TruA [Nesterenkonia sp. NBAIMH1]|uniref:tRNA pseudouridine(38-40) synthase TruA n=1 Tax=Nesterenkonia sp. NBAIMH1 TaxID=2600320 RepID=UPI0011B603C5|nr:tRNA pseudouridine(38-40) synthase TruA [Nesterenkonia sp. NBAIMH1]